MNVSTVMTLYKMRPTLHAIVNLPTRFKRKRAERDLDGNPDSDSVR